MKPLMFLVVVILAAPACSDGPGKVGDDAGKNDGGDATFEDASGSDGGSSDMAPRDGGNDEDAGTRDMTADFNNPDLPNPDGPLRIPCDSTVEEVYAVAPSPGPNGSVIDCAVSEEATAQQVMNRTAAIDGIEIESGYTSYLVAYRTTRATGDVGVGTMLLYLPDTDVQQVPSTDLVVAAHGGTNVPDDCAPSTAAHALSGSNSIVLPWIGRGYPVAAPDYAGLGTAGVMGAGNTQDLAHSSLDAAIAAQNVLDEGELTGRLLAIGQGEGAHAAYGMQALAAEYAPSIEFAGAIGYATSYPTESYAELLRAGGVFPLVDGVGALRALTAQIAYTDFYNLFGEARVREVYHPAVRDYVADAVENQCFVELAVTLATEEAGYEPPGVIGQLIDPDFRMAVVDCLNGNEDCTDDAQAFVDRAGATVVPPDPDGGDLLFISALGGARPGPQDQACLYEWLGENGKTPDGCLWSGANNINISLRAASYAVDWGIATLAGEATPDCPQNQMPACE
jgi:hypothetical protein